MAPDPFLEAIEAERARISSKTSDPPTKFPGFGLPLGFMPDVDERFPVLIGDEDKDWKASTLTIREVCMLKLMEEITNKPDWWTKVNDEEISAKWVKEALEMDWTDYVRHADFTEEMGNACIEELRVKADIYERTGLIPVMDYSACAIKSDKLVSEDLKEALRTAVAPLENVPADRRDWHPGSDEKVLDLVHPSLWPLLYGRSRILPDKRITVEDCLQHCGTGVVIPEPPQRDSESRQATWGYHEVTTLSSRFQWLPCDVNLTGERPKIESYINNVHPVKHAALYPVIEQFIEKALPAWDIIYRWPDNFDVLRFDVLRVGKDCTTPEICEAEGNYGCYGVNRPVGEGEPPREEDEEDDEDYEGSERERLDKQWFNETHKAELPNPKRKIDDRIRLKVSEVKTSGFFDNAPRIQVIVKLANIHLTPEKPTYDGGSWHIEGQLNEHICSTALYYYDCDNITDCHLDFRTSANAEDLTMNVSYEQSDFSSLNRTFAIRAHADTLQEIGSVLTRADRMLFFPNVYQHHVSPFELADKTRPGHRKILALFLVDPAIPIISTANVPPQQKQWWAENVIPHERLGNLPPEVTDMVVKSMDFPISKKEAKELRGELMAERTVLQEQTTDNLKNVEWSFCEH
ncbi:Fc.00g007060.m01.CDS01 [Cosmosporella sp. VM-42]